jgi:hypothetical protein
MKEVKGQGHITFISDLTAFGLDVLMLSPPRKLILKL